jgi:transcriptional regulator with XRE-family HTH domain
MPTRGETKSIFSPAYDHFLKELRKAREAAGLTQAQVAAKLRKPQSYVSKCEAGERRVDVVELIQFCRACGIKADAFVRRL